MKTARTEGNREARQALTLSVAGVMTIMLFWNLAMLVSVGLTGVSVAMPTSVLHDEGSVEFFNRPMLWEVAGGGHLIAQRVWGY